MLKPLVRERKKMKDRKDKKAASLDPKYGKGGRNLHW